jgi:hypothetical protein
MHLESPLLSFGTLPLLLVCLPSQIKAQNIAIVSTLVYLFLTNLIRGINSVSTLCLRRHLLMQDQT